MTVFGLSLRERAKEGLQRATKAALIGGYFHPTDADEFDLSVEGSAWLFTEALAQQIYALLVISANTLEREFKWADVKFRLRAIHEAITEHELENGMTPGTISSYIFRRCQEMDDMEPHPFR